MIKNVSKYGCQLLVTLGLSKFDVDALTDEIFGMLPEDPDGPELNKEDLRRYLDNVLEYAESGAEMLLEGVTDPVELPVEPTEPEPEPEPEVEWEKIGTYSMKAYTRIPGNPKSAGRVPRDFQKHDYPVKFVFDNKCGEFTIPTAKEDYVPKGKEHYVYWKWEKGSPAVFTKAGCRAFNVTAYRMKTT